MITKFPFLYQKQAQSSPLPTTYTEIARFDLTGLQVRTLSMQVMEKGGQGGLTYKVEGSLDAETWFSFNQEESPNGGAETAPRSIGPNGVELAVLAEPFPYAFYRVLGLSTSSNPNQRAIGQVLGYSC